jgi:CitMHS family citrate-Mg2+:H+ or citrate-Ca2+:H+ symporter
LSTAVDIVPFDALMIPAGAVGFLPFAVAVTSMPLSLVFTPDAYYFAIMPILAQTAARPAPFQRRTARPRCWGT